MPELLLFIFNNDSVESGIFIDRPRAAESDVAAAQGLQLDRNVLEDVCWVGPAVEALEKAPHFPHTASMLNHRWEPALDAVVEAGDLAGAGLVVRPQIDPRLKHGKVCPDVGAAERQNLAKFHWCVVPVKRPRLVSQRWRAGSRFLPLGKPAPRPAPSSARASGALVEEKREVVGPVRGW